jgi:hypothetical protein
LRKKFNNSGKIVPNFFFSIKKKIRAEFWQICDYKKWFDKPFSSDNCLLLVFLDPGSEMSKNEDPGSAINIPDPPH